MSRLVIFSIFAISVTAAGICDAMAEPLIEAEASFAEEVSTCVKSTVMEQKASGLSIDGRRQKILDYVYDNCWAPLFDKDDQRNIASKRVLAASYAEGKPEGYFIGFKRGMHQYLVRYALTIIEIYGDKK